MNNRTKGIITLLCLIAVMVGMGLLSAYGIAFRENNYFSYQNIKQGLDIKGGVYIVFEAETAPEEGQMQKAESILRKRLDDNNYTEATVSLQGSDRLRVEIPDVDDADAAIEKIGKTALLLFVDEEQNVVMTGSDVADAIYREYEEVENAQRVNKPGVELKLSEEGVRKFSEATANNFGKIIYIILDDVVISAPTVKQRIDTGTCSITGSFTVDEAQSLADLIKGGALPVPLKVIEMNRIGAQLGADALAGSIKAGIVGTCLVILFMLFIYRASGLAADIALIFFVLAEMLILSIFNITLSLPGIAGIILTIGMAVDANVIIFERMKEELNAGKTLRTAIESGYSRALPAILDGNITTLIAAFVLLLLGTGPIIGFAQTLILGVTISMFSALLITKAILVSFYRIGISNKTLYGAKREVNQNENS